jgi:tetratricopeptide (TPR) repeat protein
MTRGLVAAVVAVVAGALVVLVSRTESPAPAPRVEAAADVQDVRRFWAAYDEASDHRMAGRLAQAVPAYRRALAVRPDHEDGLYYLGNCLLELGEYGPALEAYERLVAVSPGGSSRGYMQIALVRASLDPHPWRDLAEAERLFARALAVDPDSGALVGLGEVALLRGDTARAERLLRRAGDDNAMSIAVPFLLGYLSAQRGDAEQAFRHFRTAVSRGELKKGAVKWTEEGDVKADPGLRWRALARQSVFGDHWIALRGYLESPGPSPADMRREYRRLAAAIRRAQP